jgi:hypothetical protein
MNDDDIDQQLRAAGARLRTTTPAEAAIRDSYVRHDHRSALDGSRWPMAMAVGLAAATIVGLVALGSIDRDERLVPPADAQIPGSMPIDATTTLPPTSTTQVESDQEPCSSLSDPAGASGSVVEVVACRQWGEGEQAIVRTDPASGAAGAATYETVGTWSTFAHRGTVDLAGPFPVSGLDSTVAFRASLDDPTKADCLVVVPTSADAWRELCVPTGEAFPTFITRIENDLVQIDVDGDTLRGAVLTEMWPSSGCTLADAEQIYDASAGPSLGSEPIPSNAFVSLACDGDRAGGTVAPVFLQPGGPDGLIYLFERSVSGWTVVDLGTGIEPFTTEAIPPIES